MLGLLRKRKDLHFERTYAADRPTVWRAWTDAQTLRRWWGPDKTTVTDCEIDLRIGGTIHVVIEAGADMGRYAGTRWPMTGTFTRIDDLERLTYDARSWTEGEEDDSTIEHTNDISFGNASDGSTIIRLFSTSSRATSCRNWASGFRAPCPRFLTDTAASCSTVVPYSRMWCWARRA